MKQTTAEPEFEPDLDQKEISNEKPPDVTSEELAALDQEATQAEITKLKKLGVIEEIPAEACEDGRKYVDLTSVFNWKFRDQRWQRKYRIVAREYRQQFGTSAETFSPTSASSVVPLILMLHLLFQWKLYALNIRDTFLSVNQKQLTYVEPRW